MSHAQAQPQPQWRMQLNNLLQRTIGTQTLTWDAYQVGGQHNSQWKAVAFINQVEYGVGLAWKEGEAKEVAAKAAFVAVYRSVYRQDPPNMR